MCWGRIGRFVPSRTSFQRSGLFVFLAWNLVHTLMPRVLLHRSNTHVVAKLEDSWMTGSQRPTPACLSVDAVKIRTEQKTTCIVACMSACPTGRRSSNQGTGSATSRLEKSPQCGAGAGRRSWTVSSGSICRDRWFALDEEGFLVHVDD
jgi:hypothetical protein